MSKDKAFAVFALLFVAPIAARAASATAPVWSISVLGLRGESLRIITFELTDEKAESCMSGEWKKARLVSSFFQSLGKRFETKDDFPTYERKGNTLTVQLNAPGLCDAYLLLSGKFNEREGKGDYAAEGLAGVVPLGTFTAKRH